MKSSVCMLIGLMAVPVAGAQSQSGMQSAGAPPPAIHSQKPVTELPTKPIVEKFLHRMFGYEPSLQYEVLGISASEIPGIAHVVVRVGAQQPATDLYVTADGEHAIMGEVIPFGTNPFASTKQKLEAQARGTRTGDSAARVTIIEFSDLQCPHCKAAQPIIDKLLADTPGAQLIFQPFPLAGHDWALQAARIGECVALQRPQAFWAYVKGVFETQDQITAATATAKLHAIATASGVDVSKTTPCEANASTATKVQESVALGVSLGVSGTPTVFVNGRKISGIAQVPYDQLRKLVEFEAAQR